jgi:hypothetical protein
MMRELKANKRGVPCTVRNCALILGINEKDVIDMIATRFGGTVAVATSAQSKYMHYRVSWTSGHAVNMAKRLIPYSLVKRAQLELLVQWPHVGRGKTYDIEDILLIRSLIARAAELRIAGYTLKEEASG